MNIKIKTYLIDMVYEVIYMIKEKKLLKQDTLIILGKITIVKKIII
jgi:hypothetical protein